MIVHESGPCPGCFLPALSHSADPSPRRKSSIVSTCATLDSAHPPEKRAAARKSAPLRFVEPSFGAVRTRSASNSFGLISLADPCRVKAFFSHRYDKRGRGGSAVNVSAVPVRALGLPLRSTGISVLVTCKSQSQKVTSHSFTQSAFREGALALALCPRAPSVYNFFRGNAHV